MSVERPRYKPNVAANKKATRIEKIFIDIPENATMRLRILAKNYDPNIEMDSEDIYYIATNHFKVKNEEGNKTALACLRDHGTEDTCTDCYLCRLSEYLKSLGDKNQKDIGYKIKPSAQWYVQAYVAEKNPVSGTWEYNGPGLLRLPVTGSNAITEIITNQDKDDEVSFLDITEGFDLNIKHHDKLPWYSADRVSKRENLDDLVPTWEQNFIKDMKSKVRQVVVAPDEQREAAIRMWGNVLDFEALSEQGL